MPRTSRISHWSLLIASLALLPACATTYTTPGGPADFARLGLTPEQKLAATDHSVAAILAKKPLVTFPASIAVAHVQAADYDSYSYHHYRSSPSAGATYSLITVRDIETDDDFNALAKLPQISGVAAIKRILVDNTLQSDEQLRDAAAKLHANLLLYYTFDTHFDTDTHVRPLGVITLGLFPNKNARVTSTASAVLMDTNNGYIYAVLESTASKHQLTNAWENEQTIDDVRKKTEREAFTQLVDSFKSNWPNVLANYNHPTALNR